MILRGKMDPDLEKEIEDIIHEIDNNGDEEIDLDEFVKCVNGANQIKMKNKIEKKEKPTKKNLLSPQPRPSEIMEEVSTKRQLRSAVKGDDEYC